MSASYYWRPDRRDETRFGSNLSSVQTTLNELTGQGDGSEWLLDRSHLPALRALHSATKIGDYQEMVNLIEEHEAIVVSVRY